MEVVSGIHQLKVPIPDNPLGFLNAYLVKTEEGCLLIDAGWNGDEAFSSLARQLEAEGVSFSDLKYIAITHAHPDHYGLVGRLMQHTKAQLVIHENDRSFLESRRDSYSSVHDEMNQWLRINGVPDTDWPRLGQASLMVLGLVRVGMPDYVVRGGEHLRIGDFDFEIIWTPGHWPGHICFYERAHRVLISGDHVLPTITPNIGLLTPSMGNPLLDYLDALRAVEALPVDVILPAHGPVFHDLAKRVQEIREHHDERMRHIVEVIGTEPKIAYQIAPNIPWDTMGVSWEELSPEVRRGAVTETLAHLELMRTEGTLAKTVKEGMALYAIAHPPAS